jgi:23S rRNA (adenine2503-C2)-methyltransferase
METATDRLRSPSPTIQLRHKAPLSVYDLTLDELTVWMRERGHSAYRARQLYEALYQQLAESFDEITALPRSLREKLEVELPILAMAPVNQVATQNRDTIKTLYRTALGDLVETVLMLYRSRATVCVSCQVGCAVGCAFCATGLMGLDRNLTTGQMVAQVIGAARNARTAGRTLTNLVMMGRAIPQLPGDHQVPVDPEQPSRVGHGCSPDDHLHVGHRSVHRQTGRGAAPGQPGGLPSRAQR